MYAKRLMPVHMHIILSIIAVFETDILIRYVSFRQKSVSNPIFLFYNIYSLMRQYRKSVSAALSHMNFQRTRLEFRLFYFPVSNDIRKRNPSPFVLNAQDQFPVGLGQLHILLLGKRQEDPE